MPRLTPWLLPLVAALALLLTLAWWWPNRAAVGVTPLGTVRVNSLSFAPFHPGQSPLTGTFPTEAEVDADLVLLAPVTRAIRTYAAIEGQYDVPALAAKHGLKVWLGIWLGADRAQNAREIARGIALANAHPETVERVIVGNEVLLRRDLPVGELIAAIDQVKAGVRQPVTYADVWEFWEQFPDIARHVDIVTIHLLPYWEDNPTGIDHAIAHVVATYHRMRAHFPGKQIAIGETGWPSAGRPREDAEPSRTNLARFIHGFMQAARHEGFDYNLIEAFDQIWKYKSEGTVGASWGLFRADRSAKFPPAQPVTNDPDWRLHAALSIALGFLLLAVGLARPVLNAAAQARLAILAMALGGALAYAHARTWTLALDNHLLLAYAVNLPGQALLALLLVRHAGNILAGHPRSPARTSAQASESVRSLFRLRPALPSGTAARLDDLTFLFLWTAAVLQLLLVFDPRYRDFPLPVFAVPLVAVLARAALRDLPRGGGGREEIFTALPLAAGAVTSAITEGPLNTTSLTWNAAALLLAIPALLRLLPSRAPS